MKKFTVLNKKEFKNFFSPLFISKKRRENRKNPKAFISLWFFFLLFYGDRGTWTLTIEKINGFSWNFYFPGLFLYLCICCDCLLWLFQSHVYFCEWSFLFVKDSSHKVSAPFVETKRFKIWKPLFSFSDIESIHFLNFFRKAQKV
jgi:hypothetical protein